jgi:hypothetical protein
MWYSLLSYFTLGRVYPRDRLRHEPARAHPRHTLYVQSQAMPTGISSKSNDAIEFTWTVGDVLNFDRTIPDALDFTFAIPDQIDF